MRELLGVVVVCVAGCSSYDHESKSDSMDLTTDTRASSPFVSCVVRNTTSPAGGYDVVCKAGASEPMDAFGTRTVSAALLQGDLDTTSFAELKLAEGSGPSAFPMTVKVRVWSTPAAGAVETVAMRDIVVAPGRNAEVSQPWSVVDITLRTTFTNVLCKMDAYEIDAGPWKLNDGTTPAARPSHMLARGDRAVTQRYAAPSRGIATMCEDLRTHEKWRGELSGGSYTVSANGITRDL